MLRLRYALPLLLLAFAVLSGGCRSGHDAGHENEERYIFVAANVQVPYWELAGAGFAKAGDQLKVKTEFVGPRDYDPNAEREAFDAAVAKKPAGILLAVTDVSVLQDGINSAVEAGIPVITLDSDAPGSNRLFFVGTDNYQAGFSGGRRLAQELKGKGNVVVFTMPGQPNLQDRLRGYRDAVANTEIKITREVDIQGDPRIAFDTTMEIVKNEKDKVQAFVCLEAQSGKEVAEVLDRNNVKGKVVMAMDTDPETLQWIQKDGIAATIAQKPYTMAFVGLEMLDTLHHHKPAAPDADGPQNNFASLPVFVNTGSALIDKANVDSFLEAKQSATSGR